TEIPSTRGEVVKSPSFSLLSIPKSAPSSAIKPMPASVPAHRSTLPPAVDPNGAIPRDAPLTAAATGLRLSVSVGPAPASGPPPRAPALPAALPPDDPPARPRYGGGSTSAPP